MNAIEESMLSEHFTAKELGKRWHMSESTVFRLFADEPDVLRLGNPNSRRRTKVSIRIPHEVAVRVYARLRGGSAKA